MRRLWLVAFLLVVLFTPLAVTQTAEARDMVRGQYSPRVLAAPTQPNLLATHVDYLIIADWHQTSRPWSGYFQAVNGKHFATPEFYKSTDVEFNLKTAWELKRTANMKTSLAVHYDHGYRSALYDADPYLGLGLSWYYAPTPKDFLTVHILDVLQTGGRVRESPCFDGFRRAFHCGTGQAWTDVRNELDGRKVEPIFTARWLHRF